MLLCFKLRFLCTNFIIMRCLLHSILFFFTKVTSVHNYNTRSAAKHSYYLPYARTNYGRFNIRSQGPSVCNTTDDNVKLSPGPLYQSSKNDWPINSLKDTRGYLLFFFTSSWLFFLFVSCSHFRVFLINILYPLYVLFCLVFVYCVCRPKLVVNIYVNWLPIIINFLVILCSQYTPNSFL